MPRKIELDGTVHEFPDDATDDEIRTALSSLPPTSPLGYSERLRQNLTGRAHWTDEQFAHRPSFDFPPWLYGAAALGGAAEAGPALIKLAPRVGSALVAGARAAAPEMGAGLAKTATGGAVYEALPHPYGYLGLTGVYRGGRQMARGLGQGARAAREAFRGSPLPANLSIDPRFRTPLPPPPPGQVPPTETAFPGVARTAVPAAKAAPAAAVQAASPELEEAAVRVGAKDFASATPEQQAQARDLAPYLVRPGPQVVKATPAPAQAGWQPKSAMKGEIKKPLIAHDEATLAKYQHMGEQAEKEGITREKFLSMSPTEKDAFRQRAYEYAKTTGRFFPKNGYKPFDEASSDWLARHYLKSGSELTPPPSQLPPPP